MTPASALTFYLITLNTTIITFVVTTSTNVNIIKVSLEL
jgi:hypothetical protein